MDHAVLDFRNALTKAVKDRVQSMGLSQKDVVRWTGLTQPQVSNLLNGWVNQQSAEVLIRAAESLGLQFSATEAEGFGSSVLMSDSGLRGRSSEQVLSWFCEVNAISVEQARDEFLWFDDEIVFFRSERAGRSDTRTHEEKTVQDWARLRGLAVMKSSPATYIDFGDSLRVLVGKDMARRKAVNAIIKDFPDQMDGTGLADHSRWLRRSGARSAAAVLSAPYLRRGERTPEQLVALAERVRGDLGLDMRMGLTRDNWYVRFSMPVVLWDPEKLDLRSKEGMTPLGVPGPVGRGNDPFVDWLLEQADRSDGVGDLARDLVADRTAAVCTAEELRTHMIVCGACFEALEALDDAIAEHGKSAGATVHVH